MSITSKGKRWELLHSLWIGWTFTLGFFNWIAFLYIAVRAKRKRWAAWGVLYSVPFILAMIFAGGPAFAGWIGDVIVALTLILGAAGIFHAFWIRKEYLLRLDALQRRKGSPAESERPSPSKTDTLVPYEKLFKVCVKYLSDGYYVGEAIPPKKLDGARASFPIPETERVAALIDTTVFGSNKTGLAFCEGGIY